MDSLPTGPISRQPEDVSQESEPLQMKMSKIIDRADAVQMDHLVKGFIREMQIAAGLDSQLVREAWDKASGARAYTLGCSYRNGRLYVSISTSVQRSRLLLQKRSIMNEINRILSYDSLFTGKADGTPPVTDIIMK